MKTVLLTVILLGIAVLLLGLKMLFVKGWRFRIGHAHEITLMSKADKEQK